MRPKLRQLMTRPTHYLVLLASLILSLFLTTSRGALAGDRILLWPGVAPGETGEIGPEQEQPQKPGDSTIRLANVTRPTLEVVLPPPEKKTGTAVVICPGGGYNILAYTDR
jgi:hypothetical protein